MKFAEVLSVRADLQKRIARLKDRLKYDYAGDFYEGCACVELNGKWGFIDKTLSKGN
jgi:hypothetical protein